MSEVINHIKVPFTGFLTTVFGFTISLDVATGICQLIAALLAILTGIITLILALRKLIS